MHAKCVGVLLHIVVVFSNLNLNYFVYPFECHTLMSLLNLLKVFKILTNKYHLHQITVFINIFWSCVTSVNFFDKDRGTGTRRLTRRWGPDVPFFPGSHNSLLMNLKLVKAG